MAKQFQVSVFMKSGCEYKSTVKQKSLRSVRKIFQQSGINGFLELNDNDVVRLEAIEFIRIEEIKEPE